MTDIHIPAAALEAGARAIHASEYDEEHYPFEKENALQQRLLRTQTRAAILAALSAWPNQHVVEDDVVYILNALILPLTEKPNAEA